MNIKTEAKIHVFFDKCINGINWNGVCLFYLFCLYIPLSIIFHNIIVASFFHWKVWLLLLALIPITGLFLIFIMDTFEIFFANIKFKHDKILLCLLLLKKHHSSSKLNLELNKLKQAVENKSQFYNDLSKSDFPYINKFISRYYRYNNNYSHKKINHTSVKDDLLQLVKSESNIQPLMLENKSSFEQLDDVLGNLVKEQIKQKTDKTYLVN